MGLFVEESMGLFDFEFFGASGAVKAILLHPFVVKCLVPNQATAINTPPLGQLPMDRCAARLCVGTVVIIGHFYLFSIMTAMWQGLCSSLHFKITRSFWSKNEKSSKSGIKRGTMGKQGKMHCNAFFSIFIANLWCQKKVAFFAWWNS